MIVVPMTLKEANDFVENFHRHNGRTSRDSGKFAIGAEHEGMLVGVSIVGRPLARMLDDGYTAEVLRTCTNDDAPKGTCSFLYSRCWKIWRAMGGRRIVTYTLQTESGASLKGAGWTMMSEVKGHTAGWASKNRPRDWDPIYGQMKFRWHREEA